MMCDDGELHLRSICLDPRKQKEDYMLTLSFDDLSFSRWYDPYTLRSSPDVLIPSGQHLGLAGKDAHAIDIPIDGAVAMTV